MVLDYMKIKMGFPWALFTVVTVAEFPGLNTLGLSTFQPSSDQRPPSAAGAEINEEPKNVRKVAENSLNSASIAVATGISEVEQMLQLKPLLDHIVELEGYIHVSII